MGYRQMQLPLAGIKVLDTTSNIAGPWAGAVLADLGASVLKVESPLGDPSRYMSPTDGDRSAYFHVVNRNKEVISLDFKAQSEIERLYSLLSECDVLLTNFLPKKLEEYGLASELLRNKFPKLIIANLSSYGSQGPAASWPGYDATLQARTGIMSVTGEFDGEPVRAGVSILDLGAGTWLAMGVLAALIKRNQTGVGGLVETSLFETGATWVSYHLSAHELTGKPSVRSGSGHPAFGPYGIFKTENGSICLGVGNDLIFSKLCKALNRSDLLDDQRFATNIDRVQHSESLKREIEQMLQSRKSSEWVGILNSSGVPAEEVLLPEDLLNDIQAKETDALQTYPDASTKIEYIPGIPLKFDGIRPKIIKPAPHKK